jgi:hypothetical protein
VAYAEDVVWTDISPILISVFDTEENLLVYTSDISTGMGMVYSAPAAPIKVAFTVGVELMGIWVPDIDAQAYAARRVLHSVIAAMYGLFCTGLRTPQSKKAGERIRAIERLRDVQCYNTICWAYAVQGGLSINE